MAIRIEYKIGEIVGSNEAIYLYEVSRAKGKPRRAMFRCKCGNHFEAAISLVRNGDVKSCGCAQGGTNRIEYKDGDNVNGMIYIEEKEPIRFKCGVVKRVALFMCVCGKTFERGITDVKNSTNPSCGCLKRKATIETHTTHGMSKHPMYKTWKRIRNRCYNKNSKDYKHYGGRGIFMSEEFYDDASIFIEYVTSLKGYGSDGLSIDRIDNNDWYTRGNLRWTDQNHQAANQNKRANSYGKYTGVRLCGKSRWMATVCFLGKDTCVGYFGTQEEAAMARDKHIIDNGLPHKLSGLPLD